MAMVLAPIAVLPLGLAVVAIAFAGHWLHLSSLVTALLAIGAVIVGNRAFHVDGLSDVADGLAASYDRERSLEVMKSGTAGPAGVVATVLVVGLQVAGLASLLGSIIWWRAAIVAGVVVCVSRVALVLCCARGVPPARADGLGATYTESVARGVAFLLWVAAAVVLGMLGWWAESCWWRGVLAAALAAAVVAVLILRCVRRFGGVTGDVFGASVELALAALLVAL
jgi:adenosylcobinamide-GDP ribazoletransferase